jgi:hypothetical protein
MGMEQWWNDYQETTEELREKVCFSATSSTTDLA